MHPEVKNNINEVKNNIKKLLIGFCLTLICGIGLHLSCQSKVKNELKHFLANQNTTPQKQLNLVSSVNKADALLKSVKESLKQPKNFPFQPKWSGDVFDPNRQIDSDYQNSLERHVMLRNFYTSSERFSEEFTQLHQLLEDQGFENDPIIRIRLYDTLSISNTKQGLLDVDQHLLHPFMKANLEKLVSDDKKYLKNLITNKYKIHDPQFLEKFMAIKPKGGFGTPDTRIEPFEPLLIQ